ncbi:MAG: DUF4159 domain-containing protein [Betaproteobacteria bacterium]
MAQHRRLTTTLAVFAVLAVTATGWAQFRGFRFGRQPAPFSPPENPAYDGRFTFARLKYETAPGGYYYMGLPAWAHGYPRAERNLMKIMNEVSNLQPRLEESVIENLDDPQLFKYPLCYMTEAGFWTLTDSEAAAFRTYLQKGGFVIFDDFRGDFRGGGGWDTFEANMRRILPDARFVDLEASHPIFHSFFEIDSLDIIPQDYDRGRPVLRGLYENNDPNKRLIAMINYNTDVSNFWEFSGIGFRPVEESNEAYKLGVNYIIYGMTH